MATKDEIKKAILEVAGNPTTGAIKDLADAFADAVVALDNPRAKGDAVKGASFTPQKETRETKPEEKR